MGMDEMSLDDLMDSGNILDTGFLANRTVNILKTSRSINDDDKEILKNVLDFIDTIKRGREQYSTGRLGSNPVEAADAFSLTLNALLEIDHEILKRIEALLITVESQLTDILDKNRVAKTKAKDAKMFFNAMLEYSVQDSSKRFYNKVEDNEWLSLMI